MDQNKSGEQDESIDQNESIEQALIIDENESMDQNDKGTFLSDDTDVFVITPNRQTFFFAETENLNFGD